MNESLKKTEPRVIKVTSGFFYRTNLRGQPGLNWGRNFNLPAGIRGCLHAINLGRHFVENLPADAMVEATIWQELKDNQREFKGRFQIPASKLIWWSAANGYYQAKSGAYWLAVPTILWKAEELPRPITEAQRTLF